MAGVLREIIRKAVREAVLAEVGELVKETLKAQIKMDLENVINDRFAASIEDIEALIDEAVVEALAL